ncbi:DUF485 domain-containing protein [Streptomyces antibioticus]|uniref:DUF485 domain-containing protein n=1 Tax=Streptomyces antibioticus TaxID=1890 RepID=UPI003F4CE6D0
MVQEVAAHDLLDAGGGPATPFEEPYQLPEPVDAALVLTVGAPSVMARPAPGGLPTGLLLALVQLPVTWLALLVHEYTARRYVDPSARRVRGHEEPSS